MHPTTLKVLLNFDGDIHVDVRSLGVCSFRGAIGGDVHVEASTGRVEVDLTSVRIDGDLNIAGGPGADVVTSAFGIGAEVAGDLFLDMGPGNDTIELPLVAIGGHTIVVV